MMATRHKDPDTDAPRENSRGAATFAVLWVSVPVFGYLAGLVYLLAQPLGRDKAGARVASLKVFLLIALTYAAYLFLRTIVAGPGLEDIFSDVFPLLAVASLSVFAIRAPVRLNLGRLYQGFAVSLILAFVLTLGERHFLGTPRPELLLGNPLNLSPTLLVPLLFMTMDRFAPSRLWVWIGFLAFGLGTYVIGGLAQSRGAFACLLVLVLVRVGFALVDPNRSGISRSALLRLSIAAGLVVLAVASNPSVANRYVTLATTVIQNVTTATDQGAPIDTSTDQRIAYVVGGIAAARERPFWGHGPQYRTEAALRHMAPQHQLRLSHLHVDFLTHQVAGGLPALLLLIAIIALPAVEGWRSTGVTAPRILWARRQIGTIGSLSLAGIAAVNNILFVPISAFTTAMTIVGVLVVLEALKTSPENSVLVE